MITIAVLALAAVLWFWIDLNSNRPRTSRGDRAAAGDSSKFSDELTNDANRTRPTKTEKLAAPSINSLAGILAEPSQFERHHALERLGFESAKNGIAAALNILAGIEGKGERAAFVRGMLAKAAEGGPRDAMRALKALSQPQDRAQGLATLVQSWQPDLSDDWEKDVLAIQSDLGGFESRMLARLLSKPALAVECARELVEGKELANLLASAARIQAARDPAIALEFGKDLKGNERAVFLKAYAEGWAASQGPAALAWAMQESDPNLRDQLRGATLAAWGANDPESALANLNAIENPAVREEITNGILQRWAVKDTEAALNWTAQLPDAQQREAATTAIQNTAPVGIGVALQAGADGYPMIRELIPGGPAGATGLLKSGYQIAAVGDGRGSFTDLEGVKLDEVTKLIRGKPGTSVVLQVIPPGAPAEQRTIVTVPRKQLLFKGEPVSGMR
jgi:hypothetical protein